MGYSNEEVILALKCCENKKCDDCPLYGEFHCLHMIKSLSIALIERLNEQSNVSMNVISNQQLFNQLVKQIKVEAYKEFSEKVKEVAYPYMPNYSARDGFDLSVENLLKEMVGDE